MNGNVIETSSFDVDETIENEPNVIEDTVNEENNTSNIKKDGEEVVKTRSNAVIELEQKLLKTTWVEEAKLIQKYVPSEDLTKNQQKLINKCIAKEDFTDKQFTELKILLNKYRKILNELRPEDTLKNVEDVVQLIQTEADFIDMMSAERTLLVHINTPRGKKGFEFTVLPINDSKIIDSLEMQIDLFRDYSQTEQSIYSKATLGHELTAEERRIYNRMNEEIIEKQSTERVKTMNVFLSNQLILKGSQADRQEREKFWELFPFYDKVSIFIKVQDMLGLTETKNSELFPTSR